MEKLIKLSSKGWVLVGLALIPLGFFIGISCIIPVKITLFVGIILMIWGYLIVLYKM